MIGQTCSGRKKHAFYKRRDNFWLPSVEKPCWIGCDNFKNTTNSINFISCQCYRLVAIYQQVATNLSISSSCNKSVKIYKACFNVLKQLVASMWIKSHDDELAASLLIICNRQLIIYKLSQTMQTHPDIGLLTKSVARSQQTCCILTSSEISIVRKLRVLFCERIKVLYECASKRVLTYCSHGLNCNIYSSPAVPLFRKDMLHECLSNSRHCDVDACLVRRTTRQNVRHRFIVVFFKLRNSQRGRIAF